MRRITLLAMAITIAALNLIMLIVGGWPDPAPLRLILNPLILIFDLALVVSSSLLGWHCWQGRSRVLGAIFFGNLGIYAVALGLRVRGVVFPRWVFAIADLYWLNLYLIVGTWQWRTWWNSDR